MRAPVTARRMSRFSDNSNPADVYQQQTIYTIHLRLCGCVGHIGADTRKSCLLGQSMYRLISRNELIGPSNNGHEHKVHILSTIGEKQKNKNGRKTPRKRGKNARNIGRRRHFSILCNTIYPPGLPDEHVIVRG